MIFKILSLKNLAKIFAFFAFFAQTIFFAENWQKSQKIVIITSTPDEFVKKIAPKCSPTFFLPKLMHKFLAHAMASDFSVAWQFSRREQLIFLLRIKLYTLSYDPFLHIGPLNACFRFPIS
jgi:hypothetical protein